MSEINPGDLNRRVAYQDRVDGARDAYGIVPATWPTVAKVWAQIRTPNGRELLNAGQFQAVVSHVLTIRRARAWFPKPTGRFVYSSPAYNAQPRTFNVVSAFDPDESNTFVSCLVTEVVSPTPAT